MRMTTRVIDSAADGKFMKMFNPSTQAALASRNLSAMRTVAEIDLSSGARHRKSGRRVDGGWTFPDIKLCILEDFTGVRRRLPTRRAARLDVENMHGLPGGQDCTVPKRLIDFVLA